MIEQTQSDLEILIDTEEYEIDPEIPHDVLWKIILNEMEEINQDLESFKISLDPPKVDIPTS